MKHNNENMISEKNISNWPFRRHGYFSPAQRMLNRLYPEVAEYSVPDRWMLEVETDWVPNTDIVEKKDSFIIRFDLPGVESDAMRITIHESILRVEGERRDEFENDTEAKRFCCERNNGTFARFIKLPESANPEKVSTEFKNGVLKLTVEKKVSAKPREIKIS
jgi:HSP20 family protein